MKSAISVLSTDTVHTLPADSLSAFSHVTKEVYKHYMSLPLTYLYLNTMVTTMLTPRRYVNSSYRLCSIWDTYLWPLKSFPALNFKLFSRVYLGSTLYFLPKHLSKLANFIPFPKKSVTRSFIFWSAHLSLYNEWICCYTR